MFEIHDLDVLGPSVLVRAADIYSSQPEAPKSPGSVDADGRVSLCAAAAVAAAGVEIHDGTFERRRFEHAVVDSDSTEVLVKTFERLGWSADVCARTVGFNDACPTVLRRQAVLWLLEGGLTPCRQDAENQAELEREVLKHM